MQNGFSLTTESDNQKRLVSPFNAWHTFLTIHLMLQAEENVRNEKGGMNSNKLLSIYAYKQQPEYSTIKKHWKVYSSCHILIEKIVCPTSYQTWKNIFV